MGSILYRRPELDSTNEKENIVQEIQFKIRGRFNVIAKHDFNVYLTKVHPIC